jgi:hypothetical protein
VGGHSGLGFWIGGEGVGDAGLGVTGSSGVMLAQHVSGGFPESCHGYVGNFALGGGEFAEHVVGGSLGQADGEDFEGCRILVR